jgi:hypothetical protein
VAQCSPFVAPRWAGVCRRRQARVCGRRTLNRASSCLQLSCGCVGLLATWPLTALTSFGVRTPCSALHCGLLQSLWRYARSLPCAEMHRRTARDNTFPFHIAPPCSVLSVRLSAHLCLSHPIPDCPHLLLTPWSRVLLEKLTSLCS